MFVDKIRIANPQVKLHYQNNRKILTQRQKNSIIQPEVRRVLKIRKE